VLGLGAMVICGWLLWQYGLGAAMIASMLYHLVWLHDLHLYRRAEQPHGGAEYGGMENMSKQHWSIAEVYEIRFRGYLDVRRAQMFEGLEMVQAPDGETVLTGPVTDQAALHGILGRIRDLGVPLLSVKCLTQAKVRTTGEETESMHQPSVSRPHVAPGRCQDEEECRRQKPQHGKQRDRENLAY
jgi:hypothetical protein